MSIKHFHNIACPKCGKDTLHIKLICQECGSCYESQYAASVRLRRERYLRALRKAKGNAPLAGAILAAPDKAISAARRAEFAAIPLRKNRYP